MFESVFTFLVEVLPVLEKNQQRIAVAMHVDIGCEDHTISSFITQLDISRSLIISPCLEDGLPAEKTVNKLGEEYDLVVFDARKQINLDALGVVSGVLCGGGCLIFILPEINKWQTNLSPYMKYLDRLLINEIGVYYFKEPHQSHQLITTFDKCSQINAVTDQGEYRKPYKSSDQQVAVEELRALIQTKEKCCAVLTAGRGRGKSSALGLLSAELLEQQDLNILITAPRLSVSDPIFKHLQLQCSDGVSERGVFRFNNSSARFVAPDALIDETPAADVLLIDEAAAIPVSMLKQLLDYYPKIIFSTTTHGYEGTGRGFVIKFYRLLDEYRNGWHKIELHQPIRWAINDCLESWIEKLLFLNLQAKAWKDVDIDLQKTQVRLIDRKNIIYDKQQLSQIFALLVSAHYRTRPSDFQYLLDSDDVRIYSLSYKDQVIAVLAINQEGGFEESLSLEIYRGERRPKGHLLAQTLCFHAGDETAACLKYARVMRIAVHTDLQRHGIGSYFLKQVIEQEKAIDIDVLGSSFSATEELLAFWNKAEMQVLRMGFSRDHVTAAHSAVVGVGLSDKGVAIIESLSTKFQRNFYLWVSGPLSSLSDDVKHYISRKTCDVTNKEDLNGDMQDIKSFAEYNRNYEACMPAIFRWLQQIKMLPAQLDVEKRKIIMLIVEERKSWKQVVIEMKLSGKSEAVSLLRAALSDLMVIRGISI